jgi:hypothetical protein
MCFLFLRQHKISRPTLIDCAAHARCGSHDLYLLRKFPIRILRAYDDVAGQVISLEDGLL